ncbi:MAG: SPOR domain-containing protein [Candidatus Margulisiibacteriota bacterium]
MEDISQNFPVIDQENEEQETKAKRRPFLGTLVGLVKNLLIFIALIGIIVGSFWISFELGKKILFPAKNVKNKIKVAVPEPPPSIMALQELEKIMSDEVGKEKKGKSVLPKVSKDNLPVKKTNSLLVVPKVAPKVAVVAPKIVVPVEIPATSTTLKATKPVKKPVKKAVKKVAKAQNKTGNGYFKVQAGLYVEKEKAEEMAGQVAAAGYSTYLKKVESGWRVQVGAYKNKSEADALKDALDGKGIKSVVLFE